MKRLHLNIKDVFDIPDSVIYDPDKFRPVFNVAIDSRKIRKGSLFIAIKGKQFDGHDFVENAIEYGATSVVINKNKLNRFNKIDVPLITVKNTRLALGDIARIWRKKINTKVIGITGSSGKTTVKDMLSEILSEKYKVNKTIANNNNDVGVPLTILSTNENHDVLVAELGTNHFGEIPYTAKILSPDYSLITNIGSSHLEFLRTRNGVWKEKSFLFNETLKNNGKVFLNYDDPIIKARHSKDGKLLSYGFTGNPDVLGKIISYSDDGKPRIVIKYKKKSYELALPVYGEQAAKNFLAACAVALEFGLSFDEINNASARLKTPSGRLNVQLYKNFILIDDTYNANPDSTRTAIDLVGKIKSFRRKILFLGDMLELGEQSKLFHRHLKKVIVKNVVDEVYTIGSQMRFLNKELNSFEVITKHFSRRNSLIDFIKNSIFDDSVILVKGSRGMKMEEFIEEIKLKSIK